MLAIRLQRLGRKGYPVYRVAVQEAQRHPSSGRVVAYVGSYNPHTKEVKFDKEKVGFYLKNGAQPSPRVVKLLVTEKITLPDWVKQASKKEKAIRNPEKLRKNQPVEEVAEEPKADVSSEAVVEETVEEEAEQAPAEEAKETDGEGA